MRSSTRGVKAPLGPSWCVLTCAFLLLSLLSGVHGNGAPVKKPHIVMIVADDLGWDDVSFHGSPQIPTPTLDWLASSGVVLNNYYVSPLDTPTRASFMTGKYPIRLGLQHDTIHDRQPMGVPLEETFLPERLRQLEYATHAVGKWQLGFFNKEYTPTYRGFDSFYGFWTSGEDYFNHVAHDEGYGVDLRRNLELADNETGVYGTDLFTQEAVKVINGHTGDKPLFLYLAQQAVHVGNMDDPLQAPQKYLDKFHYISDERRRTYAGMVAALDESVRLVVNALKSKGLYDNSIIIFTTDNGAAAGGLDQSAGSNFPLRGVKNTLWEGGVRAVGLVHSPLIKKRGRASDALIDASDWLPTLHYLAGGDPSSLGKLDGFNVWEAISTGAPSPRYELLHGLDTIKGTRSLRMGDYKIVENQPLSFFSDWYPRPARLHELDDLPKVKAFQDSIIDCTIRHPHPLLYTHAPICDPVKKSCLFNIKWDPCEYHNLADFMPNTLKVMKDRLDFYGKGAKPAIYPEADEVANPDLRGGVWMSWRDDPSIPTTVDDFVYPFSYDDTSVDSSGRPLNKKLSRFMSDQLHTLPHAPSNTSTVPAIEDIIINFDNSGQADSNATATAGASQKAQLATMATTLTTAATPSRAPTPIVIPPAIIETNNDQTTPAKLAYLWKPTKPPTRVYAQPVAQTTPPQVMQLAVAQIRPISSVSSFVRTVPPSRVNINPVQLDSPTKPTARANMTQAVVKTTVGQNQTSASESAALTPGQIEKLVGQTASRMSSEPHVWKPLVPIVPTHQVINMQHLPGLKPAGAVPDAVQDVLKRHGFTKHTSSSQVHEVSRIVPKLRPFHKHKFKLPLSSHKRPIDSVPEVLDIIDDDETRGHAFASEGSGRKEVPAIFDIIDEEHNKLKQSVKISGYHTGPIATSKNPLRTFEVDSGMGVGLTKLPKGVSVFGALGNKLLKQRHGKKQKDAQPTELVPAPQKFIGHITLDGRHYYVVGTENEELDSVHTKVEGNRITLHLPKSGKLNNQGAELLTPSLSVSGKSKSRIDSLPSSQFTGYADDSEEGDENQKPERTLAAHNVTAVVTGNGTKCEKVVQLDTSDNAVVVSSVVIVVIASAMVVGVAVVAMVAVVARHCQNSRS